MANDADRTVDFAAVKRNASEEGIPLSEIAIKYENLTDHEAEELQRRGLLPYVMTGGSALGKFADNGDVLFPSKAVAVLYLAA
jgi:hypothetical protein